MFSHGPMVLDEVDFKVAFVSGQLQAGHCDDEPSCGGNGLKWYHDTLWIIMIPSKKDKKGIIKRD